MQRERKKMNGANSPFFFVGRKRKKLFSSAPVYLLVANSRLVVLSRTKRVSSSLVRIKCLLCLRGYGSLGEKKIKKKVA